MAVGIVGPRQSEGAAMNARDVIDFAELTRRDIAVVGGKNASLGELYSVLRPRGVNVPGGFATSAEAFRLFLVENSLVAPIEKALASYHAGLRSLAETGSTIRQLIESGTFPQRTEDAIRHAYRRLGLDAREDDIAVAVRSSATAEDLPEASFAGQQETFLNVRGEEAVIDACRRCFASLYTDRAILYRETHGFAHEAVALSVGVQHMIRADQAGAGVMFSIDTESGCPDVVMIDAAWGLGEMVVQGRVDPDEYQVFKPLLETVGKRPIIARTVGAKKHKMIYGRGETGLREVPTSKNERDATVLDNTEILQLARWAVQIERHYGCAMDIEWAKDGADGELYILQARPETVQQRREALHQAFSVTGKGALLVEGAAIGQAAASGRTCLLEDIAEMDRFEDGAILVAPTTDPDWLPVMKRAAAIVTDHGGRTSHAAIVSRELGLPALVGTGNATRILSDGQDITVDCSAGERGFVYSGTANIETRKIDLAHLPRTQTKTMLNMANPAAALRWWRLPADGVGLVRMEFVIANTLRIHPMALLHPGRVTAEAAAEIAKLTQGYADKAEYFVDGLATGLGRIAALGWPDPVIVRMSDFKSNEYAELIGGDAFEPREANPMIGFRGASRYYSDLYRDAFALECRAIKRLREEMGFMNVAVMIPFCRSAAEADRVLQTMAEFGLARGDKDLEIYVMCEIPSNVVEAQAFAQRFDGFSIGSNDLTQLTLGIDRDSELLAGQFDERDPAVKWMIRHVIAEAHRHGAKVGLCGQGPSDHPEFARFLVESGIDSISVTPDSFAEVRRHISHAEEAEQAA
jgi:pyruvate, water dikinase